MTAVERAADQVLSAALRWHIAQGQDLLSRRIAEDCLLRAVERHGRALRAAFARRDAALKRAANKRTRNLR